MSTAVTTQTNSGAVTNAPVRVEVALSNMMEKFRAVLPAEIPAERFCRVAVNALQDTRVQEALQTPEGQQSVITEIQTAATDGLLLDKREAFLNVYSTKVGNEWIKLAKYMPMYQGLMKLARNSGVISDIKCQIVKKGDVFRVQPLAIPPVFHEYPEDITQRGEFAAVYAVAQFKDGTWSNVEVMTVADVEKIRQASPAKDKDAWKLHWNEMARKTVIRRLSKYLPKSTDGMERLHNAASRGDHLMTLDAPSTPALPRKQSMATKLLAPAQPAPEPKKEPEPPKQKAETKAKGKTETKAKPKDDDDGMQGLDDRGGGGVWRDPMTGEIVDDDDHDGDDGI